MATPPNAARVQRLGQILLEAHVLTQESLQDARAKQRREKLKIAADRVVIARPEGSIKIRLQDPSKPRAAATATPTVTTMPRQVVPQGPAVPPGQLAPPQPVALPTQAPPTPPQVRRRVRGLTQGQPSRG